MYGTHQFNYLGTGRRTPQQVFTQMSQYEFGVAMSCSGCSNSVNRALTKLDGVKNIDVSLEDQRVRVDTDESVGYEKVHETIAKTGKKINYGKTL